MQRPLSPERWESFSDRELRFVRALLVGEQAQERWVRRLIEEIDDQADERGSYRAKFILGHVDVAAKQAAAAR